MLKKILNNIGMVVAIVVLGFIIQKVFLSPTGSLNGDRDTSQMATDVFFAATLPNENNVSQALNQYKGKVLVVNFWATWCPPCREEMPALSELHEALKGKNVAVLGVAIDEMALVKAFSTETPVSYPLLIAEDEGMALSSQLGNDKGVLPYTIIIDTKGNVVDTFFGRITKEMLEDTLQAYM
jgi:thiol-disulfide isomerase/thioredoxin